MAADLIGVKQAPAGVSRLLLCQAPPAHGQATNVDHVAAGRLRRRRVAKTFGDVRI